LHATASSRKGRRKHVRRIAMLLGLTVILVVVAAGVALAVVKTCGGIPCRGTDNDDVLYERIRKEQGDRIRPDELRDRIFGLDGDDEISAVVGTDDRDVLEGGRNRDDLHTNDGDTRDAARGGRGRDTCFIDSGDATSSCERIDDTQAAGVGPTPQGFGSSATPEETTGP
jgi:hypothetical protein